MDYLRQAVDGVKDLASTIKEKAEESEYLQSAASYVKSKVWKTPLEKDLHEAINNETWQATNTLLYSLASQTNNQNDSEVIEKFVDEHLKLSSKDWRKIYKTLVLINVIIKVGSVWFVRDLQNKQYQFRMLSEFYHQDNGMEKGGEIRTVARQIVDILNNPEALEAEREKAKSSTNRMVGFSSNDYQSGNAGRNAPSSGPSSGSESYFGRSSTGPSTGQESFFNRSSGQSPGQESFFNRSPQESKNDYFYHPSAGEFYKPPADQFKQTDTSYIQRDATPAPVFNQPQEKRYDPVPATHQTSNPPLQQPVFNTNQIQTQSAQTADLLGAETPTQNDMFANMQTKTANVDLLADFSSEPSAPARQEQPQMDVFAKLPQSTQSFASVPQPSTESFNAQMTFPSATPTLSAPASNPQFPSTPAQPVSNSAFPSTPAQAPVNAPQMMASPSYPVATAQVPVSSPNPGGYIAPAVPTASPVTQPGYIVMPADSVYAQTVPHGAPGAYPQYGAPQQPYQRVEPKISHNMSTGQASLHQMPPVQPKKAQEPQPEVSLETKLTDLSGLTITKPKEPEQQRNYYY